MEIGIRELKDRLSEILQRAHSGEEITITSHGKPLCQIAPIESKTREVPGYLQNAAASGKIILAPSPGLNPIVGFKPKKGTPSTAEVLKAGRRERNF